MQIHDAETKLFIAKFLARLAAHNLVRDTQVLLPKPDYERRYGRFPRYFSGWFQFVASRDLLPGKLVHKKLNGLDLVAYRDAEGRPVVHANRCPHLGGLFAPQGRVNDGKLTCSYHGYTFDRGVPQSGPRELRSDPKMCIPCFPTMEVAGLVMFWFDAAAPDGIGEPAWPLTLPDLERFPRRSFARSIAPTHSALLNENIVDDLHFMHLHGAPYYKAEPQTFHEKHRFVTKNTMRVPAPKIGPFRLRGAGDTIELQMDSEFLGLGIHINYIRMDDFEARFIHCNTPIVDEITEWNLAIYMQPRSKWPSLDVKAFFNWTYPWSALAQTYFLHTQDRRAVFESGEYRFYDEVPKGMEKIDAYRRWISEQLLGEPRPFGKNSQQTKYVPLERIVRRAEA